MGSVENYISELKSRPAKDHNFPAFSFKPIIAIDVIKAMRKVCTNAVGSDNISIHLINRIMFAILPTITFIFNASLKQGIFPSAWKSAIVRPLPKTPSPKTCADLRPISILPVLSKGMERIIHWQLTEFLSNYNILNPYQSGFRPNHSTETALLRITDDFRYAMENSQASILTLFDFSKAFDCVHHQLLLMKLRAIGFSVGALTWMGSYLGNRRQCVRVGDNVSEWKSVACGVPQGSILGPLLFSLFVNDISAQLETCRFHMYADDLQIYNHFKIQDINLAVRNMNNDITNIVSWTRKHGLKLNPKKTKPIIIAHSRLRNRIVLENVPSIVIEGDVLPYCEKVKSLGLTLNCTLSWSDAVNETCNKVFRGIHILKRLQSYLPLNIKLLLVKSLILPYFDYCSAVVNDMTVAQADKLQRSLNYCVRFVYNLRRDDHITPFLIQSKMLKLTDMRLIKILTLLFSIRQSGLPKYFSGTFQLVSCQSARETRSGSSVLRIPNHTTVAFDKSFTVVACRLWNSLPNSITSIVSRKRFVTSLKSYYAERMAADALVL